MILLKEDEDAVRRHEELCTFLDKLTVYLGRDKNDEWEAFLIKYIGGQCMGEHGDYGGVKSEKYFMMRLTLGLGGSRTIRFRAKRIGENAYSDRAGKLLSGIDFELILSSGVNAYLQSPFGSGKNLLGFFNNKGVRGCHSSVHEDYDAAIIVIDFPLRTIEDVLRCLQLFEGIDISLDMFD